MKITQHVNQNLSFEVEGSDTKECFKQLSQMHDVFNVGSCVFEEDGKLSYSNMIKPVVRKVVDAKGKTFESYEWRCTKNGYTLRMGQRSDNGALFPRRSNEGGPIGNNGWFKIEKEESNES